MERCEATEQLALYTLPHCHQYRPFLPTHEITGNGTLRDSGISGICRDSAFQLQQSTTGRKETLSDKLLKKWDSSVIKPILNEKWDSSG